MTHTFDGNRVTRHTGTEFPIFQAPIGLISRADLVGAVSAAGGVGLHGNGFAAMPELQQQFDLIRARSNRPFGLHLMIPVLARRPEREKRRAGLGAGRQDHFVTTGYGDPTRYITRLKDAGVITYHLTDSLDEAQRAQDAGVDGIVLGGAEKGGGHRPTTFTPSRCCRRRAGASTFRSWRPAASSTGTAWRPRSRLAPKVCGWAPASSLPQSVRGTTTTSRRSSMRRR